MMSLWGDKGGNCCHLMVSCSSSFGWRRNEVLASFRSACSSRKRLADFHGYQRVSPDCLPLANGRKSNPRTCKEEEADNGRLSAYTSNGSSGGGFDGKSLRYRPSTSPSSTTTQDQNFTPPLAASDSPQSGSPHHHANRAAHEGSGASGSPGGDVILQWGHNKRSRGSRAESRIAAASAAGGDETASQTRQVIKIHRRTVAGGGGEKLNSMPPPCGSGSYSRGTNLRPAMPIRDHHHAGSLLNRTTSDDHRAATASPSRTHNGTSSRVHPNRTTAASSAPAEKRSSSSPDKPDHHHHITTNNNYNHHKPSPNNHNNDYKLSAAVAGGSGTAAPQSETAEAVVEKLSLEAFEWPRIYVSLSRKEKEDDFLVMKGSKLPQRPKKRAKNVDKALQYCFPGMWLSDLTRGRYEVREKKCAKKRRRGLKGMEGMDSESE